MSRPRHHANGAEKQCAYRARKEDVHLPPTADPVPGTVYIIEAVGTGRYKIGFTQNLTRRMHALRHGSPFPLRIAHAVESDRANLLEAELHARLRDHRVYGEWFELDQKTVEAASF